MTVQSVPVRARVCLFLSTLGTYYHLWAASSRTCTSPGKSRVVLIRRTARVQAIRSSETDFGAVGSQEWVFLALILPMRAQCRFWNEPCVRLRLPSMAPLWVVVRPVAEGLVLPVLLDFIVRLSGEASQVTLPQAPLLSDSALW